MNLDELHDIIRRIDRQLENRSPNSVAWNILLRATLRELMQWIVNAAFVE